MRDPATTVLKYLALPPSTPPFSSTTIISISSVEMSTSLDQLKATGTVVVSDSGDFECKPALSLLSVLLIANQY